MYEIAPSEDALVALDTLRAMEPVEKAGARPYSNSDGERGYELVWTIQSGLTPADEIEDVQGRLKRVFDYHFHGIRRGRSSGKTQLVFRASSIEETIEILEE